MTNTLADNFLETDALTGGGGTHTTLFCDNAIKKPPSFYFERIVDSLAVVK